MRFQPVSKQPSASPVVCKIGLFKILMGPPELSTWRGRNRRNPKFTSYSLSDRKTGIRIPPSMNNFIHSWYFPSSTKAVSFAGCCFVYFSKQYPLATRPPFFFNAFPEGLESRSHTHKASFQHSYSSTGRNNQSQHPWTISQTVLFFWLQWQQCTVSNPLQEFITVHVNLFLFLPLLTLKWHQERNFTARLLQSKF